MSEAEIRANERARIAAWLRLEMAEWPADDRLPSLVEDLETGAWETLLADGGVK